SGQHATLPSSVAFLRKDLAGSRLACLALTGGSDEQVAERLTALAGGFGGVSPGAARMPRGLLEPEEAPLGRTEAFLSSGLREELMSWWLAARSQRARLPTWDIAAECTVEGRRGLLLVEAKAHDREPDASGKMFIGSSSIRNHERIGRAIGEAS